MLLISPVSGAASDAAGAAMLSVTGRVTVNGNLVNASTAIFPGNVIETNPGSVANLTVSGSSVVLQPESLARFDGNEIYLDHGGMTVGTSSMLSVHVKCVTAAPAASEWTQFDVVNVNEMVQVVDRKGGVNIRSGAPFDLLTASSGNTPAEEGKPVASLTEGQQYNRHESEVCPNSDKKGWPSAGIPSILSSPYAPYIGGGAIGGIIIWLLHHPASPISSQAP